MEEVRKIIQNDLPSIEGWCAVEKAMYMVDLVEKNNLDSYLELGVYCGRSLLPVALAMKCLHERPTIIGVDAWNLKSTLQGVPDKTDSLRDDWWSRIDHNGLYLYTINILRKYGLERDVQLYRTPSADYVRFVDKDSLSMLHQDGNHSTEVSCQEVELYHDKVKVGGFWIFDDTNWESTKPAQNKLESYGYSCVYDANGWKAYQRLK